jgi:hypothetical protein
MDVRESARGKRPTGGSRIELRRLPSNQTQTHARSQNPTQPPTILSPSRRTRSVRNNPARLTATIETTAPPIGWPVPDLDDLEHSRQWQVSEKRPTVMFWASDSALAQLNRRRAGFIDFGVHT